MHTQIKFSLNLPGQLCNINVWLQIPSMSVRMILISTPWLSIPSHYILHPSLNPTWQEPLRKRWVHSGSNTSLPRSQTLVQTESPEAPNVAIPGPMPWRWDGGQVGLGQRTEFLTCTSPPFMCSILLQVVKGHTLTNTVSSLHWRSWLYRARWSHSCQAEACV